MEKRSKNIITIEKTFTFKKGVKIPLLNEIHNFLLFKLRDNISINFITNSDAVNRKTEKYLKKIFDALYQQLKMNKSTIPNLSAIHAEPKRDPGFRRDDE